MTLAGKKNLEPLTLLRAKKALKGPKIEQTRKKKRKNELPFSSSLILLCH